NKRPLPATSWEDMKKGFFKGASENLPKRKQLEANRLSLKNERPWPGSQNIKRTKRKRTDSQMGHNGQIIATDSEEVRKEIAVALKKDSPLEGRRLKRQAAKKNAMVCFLCRKPSPGIADCPAARDSQDMDTGICDRCASTEHAITKGKAKADPALGKCPFAKRFVCGEMGYLSRSGPDNPLCGSVGHLKKDYQMVTVGRWAKGMSTDYEEILDAPKLQKPKTKTPKVVTCWQQLAPLLVTTSSLLSKAAALRRLEWGSLMARTTL
uniref:Uncharacterized protein n=1 Tax=Cebus imitator TaxID=2715852 RepID=A0A2K5R8K1_CEBIM